MNGVLLSMFKGAYGDTSAQTISNDNYGSVVFDSLNKKIWIQGKCYGQGDPFLEIIKLDDNSLCGSALPDPINGAQIKIYCCDTFGSTDEDPRPSSNGGYIISLRYYTHAKQIFIDYNTSNVTYIRHFNSGWTDWVRFDGSGTGMTNFELVTELPTDNLFEGRTVYYNNISYIYKNSTWAPLCEHPTYQIITADDYETATLDTSTIYFVTEVNS